MAQNLTMKDTELFLVKEMMSYKEDELLQKDLRLAQHQKQITELKEINLSLMKKLESNSETRVSGASAPHLNAE